MKIFALIVILGLALQAYAQCPDGVTPDFETCGGIFLPRDDEPDLGLTDCHYYTCDFSECLACINSCPYWYNQFYPMETGVYMMAFENCLGTCSELYLYRCQNEYGMGQN